MAIKNPLLAAKRPGVTPVKGTMKMKEPMPMMGKKPMPPGMKKGGAAKAKCYSKGGKS